jgi:hypothetical protein
MPNHLCLVDKVTGNSHMSRDLIEVDEKLCAGLGVPCDPVGFYLGWVDWMAFYVSDNWDAAREALSFRDAKVDAIVDWLEANYNLNSFATIGRG